MKIFKNKKAFTLIEIMISVAIIAGLFIPVILILTFSTKSQVASTNTLYAVTLAEEKIEEYKFLGYSVLKDRLMKIVYTEKKDLNKVFFIEENRYGKIDGYEKFNRATKISFSIPEGEKVENYDKRIKIEVVMKWKEMVGTKERERTQNFFTIVTSKEFN
jgi:prepilin-type N-terminal cleavage/methylation domain-containing protein